MNTKKSWFEYLPHPVMLLFGMVFGGWILSYLIPKGQFDRVDVDGKMKVVPGSFQVIEGKAMSFMDFLMCFPLGFKTAVDIVFIVLISGVMFGFMQKTGAIENGVGTLVKNFGQRNQKLIIVLMTFIFGALGMFVGYENNIALVPIACLLSLAIGGDLMLAAGISVAAITVGFGTSPFNAYTVGVGHKVAELPLFSGWELRLVISVVGLTLLSWYNLRYYNKIRRNADESLALGIDVEGLSLTKPLNEYSLSPKNIGVLMVFLISIVIVLYGVFAHHWFINQISAIFVAVIFVISAIYSFSLDEIGKTVFKSLSEGIPGAFMVGLAAAVKVSLETGMISDTIAHFLSSSLSFLPIEFAAGGMTIAQTIMNFAIPSGSGQALATLPVMIPVGEILGLTRQTTVLAFQIGDGVSNLINPSLGGLIAMIAMCRIPLDRWLKFIVPFFLFFWIVCIIFVIFSVPFKYGV